MKSTRTLTANPVPDNPGGYGIEGHAPTAMDTRRMVTLSLLAAYAVMLHGVEAVLPTPVPWLKLGLANIITLVTLALYGLRAGMTVTVLRVVLGSLLLGTFLGPSFFLSMAGGVASTLLMGAALRTLGRWLSLVGISLLGAFAHNLAQVAVVYAFLVPHPEVFFALPLMWALAIPTGVLTGLAAAYLVEHLKRIVENGGA